MEQRLAMNDPFVVLGVSEGADDAVIKDRYLALVRAFPPDRDPVRFQEIRSAYEAVRTERERLEVRLLRTRTNTLTQLMVKCLDGRESDRHQASAPTVAALILRTLRRVRP